MESWLTLTLQNSYQTNVNNDNSFPFLYLSYNRKNLRVQIYEATTVLTLIKANTEYILHLLADLHIGKPDQAVVKSNNLP